MNWGAPHILWLLLALPVWLWAAHRLLRARRRRLAAWVDEKNAPFLLPGRNPAAAARRIWLRTLALACLILALARPQWGFHWEEITRRGLDLLVVLDTSRSMTAADIKPSRLQQAKWGIHDLLRALRGDRVGLIPFAGSSLLQCPLTTDYAAFAMTLDDLYCGIIPRGGTAIAQALRTAIDSFPNDTTADRCILLVTDGEDHEGDPLSLLPELKEKGIRLYAIGIGTLEGEMIPGDASTGSAYFKDRKGQIVKTTLHEDILQQLATSTGGAYVRSAAGDTGLERVFRESIDKLKRTEAESRTARINEERFQWPLLLSLLLLLLESLTPDRSVGARAARPLFQNKSASFIIILATLPLLSPAPARAQSPRPLFTAGLADLAASNYPSAASNFLAAAELAPTNNLPAAPALYNAALATAAAGDPDAASTLLAESARAIPDLDAQARAYYNRGNTLYALSDADPTSTNAPALIAEALQSYENAIALAPSAPDYKANYELALLKQQQIQQQQQQQQQQQNKDQSQDQQNQDQSSSDDQQQSQQQDQQQEQQQEQQEQAQQQSQSQSQESQESQESQQQSQQQSQEPPSEQMTPEEATQLLDAMRAREQSQRDQLKPLFGRPIPVENDW
ncbi:MAG: VWA domain-containing protein [Kiritimatiellae bacterium]|nr:VWA domain-containing protein [Kiritimatiellia bacterium]